MAAVDEVVAGLTKVDANILARFASGEPIDAIAANTGQRRKEVERLVQHVATFNAQYARTLALAWQRANSPGRIGSAPAAAPSTSARLREVERERDELAAKWEREFERVTAERDDARATAGRWREQCGKAQAELATTRQTIVALMTRVESLGADLEQAEARGPRVDDLVFAVEARHCPPCGWTSSYETHHHPTIPVRVVIHRTEGPTT